MMKILLFATEKLFHAGPFVISPSNSGAPSIVHPIHPLLQRTKPLSQISQHQSQSQRTQLNIKSNKQHRLTVNLQNIRSLFPKYNFVYDFLTVNDNDFLFLTETWLNSNTTNSMIEHRNYELIRSDRPNRKGGGTAVYYKKSLNVRELTKPFISDENMNFDYIAINLKSSDTSITFLCYYIPPDSSSCQLTITNLCKSIHFFLTSANPIVLLLLGDFNLPNIQWDTSTAKGSSSETFLNFCLQNGLQQSITSAT